MTKQELLALAAFDELTFAKVSELATRSGTGVIGELDREWLRTILGDYENCLKVTLALIGDRERLREALDRAHSHCGWAQAQEQASNVRNCAASAAQVLSEALTASDERFARLRGEKP